MTETDRAGGAPPALRDVAEVVERRLERVLDAERARWAPVDVDLGDLVDRLEQFVCSGGKRIRPAFCWWAYVAGGGDADDGVVHDVGAAFELLHAFALIHDDVMDGADRRRGRRSVHAGAEEDHQDRELRGEARRFGEGVAILVGDLAHSLAFRLLGGVDDRVREAWAALEVELVAGQYLDLVHAARGGTDLAQARRIARFKSGAYTVERPLQIGARLAGGSPALEEALARFGRPLGEAFQVRDDLLGVFGDPSRTGKPVGADLRQAKPTPLLAIASARATGADRELLAGLGRADLDDDDVLALAALIERTGARDEVEALLGDLVEESLSALEDPIVPRRAAAALASLAQFVVERES